MHNNELSKLEYWSIGVLKRTVYYRGLKSNTPILQYSSTLKKIY